MAIRVEVWGDYALFTRPEMKTERVSYDVMTPSAARGLLESIYWHPGMKWCIDRIHVCSPIRFTNIRRNEVKDTISARKVKTVMEKGQGELYLATPESIQQRAAMVLRDVHYVIDAHFDLTENAAPGDNAGKFQDMYTAEECPKLTFSKELMISKGCRVTIIALRMQRAISGNIR